MPIVPRPNANAPPDEQLQFRFAIEQAPHRVRSCGLVETHFFPKVSLGSPWWYTRRVPVRTAWRRWPEIQLDSATAHVAVILDVDHDIQTCLNVALGPLVRLPTWICTSPRGHSHVVYLLSRPVLRTEDARKRPLVLLARIAEYYTGVYCADTGYAAELTHNPCHPRYADDTTWWAERAWSLPELAEAIPAAGAYRPGRSPSRVETAPCSGRPCGILGSPRNGKPAPIRASSTRGSSTPSTSFSHRRSRTGTPRNVGGSGRRYRGYAPKISAPARPRANFWRSRPSAAADPERPGVGGRRSNSTAHRGSISRFHAPRGTGMRAFQNRRSPTFDPGN